MRDRERGQMKANGSMGPERLMRRSGDEKSFSLVGWLVERERERERDDATL